MVKVFELLNELMEEVYVKHPNSMSDKNIEKKRTALDKEIQRLLTIMDCAGIA